MSEIMAWGQGIDQRRKAGTRGWQTSPSSLPAQPKPLAWKPAPAPRSAAEAALASATDLPPLRRRPALPSGYEPPDYVVAPVRLTDGRVLHINAHDLADPRYVNVRNLNPDGTPVKGRAGLQARAVFDGAELLAPPAYGTDYRPARPGVPGLEDYMGQPLMRDLLHRQRRPGSRPPVEVAMDDLLNRYDPAHPRDWHDSLQLLSSGPQQPGASGRADSQVGGQGSVLAKSSDSDFAQPAGYSGTGQSAPRWSPVASLRAGDQDVAMYTYQDQPDGLAAIRVDVPDREAAARGVSANRSFEVRLPAVTAQEYETELARRKQVLDSAAAHLGELQQRDRESAARPAGFWSSIWEDSALDRRGHTLADQDRARAALQTARAQYELLRENGRDVMIHDRLRTELARNEYRDRVGEYHGFNEFAKGVVDIGTGSLALGARAIDAWNGNDEQMQKVGEIQRAYEGALPGSSRRDLEGGTWNRAVQSAQHGAGSLLPFMGAGRVLTGLAGAEARAVIGAGRLGVTGAGASAVAAGQDQLQIQQRIDEARARGDEDTAHRLSVGRDLHAMFTAGVSAGVERLSPVQMLRPGGQGLRGMAVDAVAEAVENPLSGIAQRTLVDPVLEGGRVPTISEIFAPVGEEALSGLMTGVPMAGLAHGFSKPEPPLPELPRLFPSRQGEGRLDNYLEPKENAYSHETAGSNLLEETLQYLQGVDARGTGEGIRTDTHPGRSERPDSSGHGAGSHSPKSARKFLRGRGALIPLHWLDLLLPRQGGAEHQTFTDPADSGWRIKVTGPDLRFQDGTPHRLSEAAYLERLNLANIVLGDQARLLGVITTPKGNMLVTRQPEVTAEDPENPHPEEADIEDWLKQTGFVNTSPDPWHPVWTRVADGVQIRDAHPGNFIKAADGLHPIDLQLEQSPAAKAARLRIIPWEETSAGRAALDRSPASQFNATHGSGRSNLIVGRIPADGSTQFDRSNAYDRFRTLHAALETRSKELSAGPSGQQWHGSNAQNQTLSGVPTIRFDGEGRISLAVDQGRWWKSLLQGNDDNAAVAADHAEELASEELWHVSQLVAMRNDWLNITPSLRGSFTNHVQQESQRLLSDVRAATGKLSPAARATVQEAMHGAWATYFNDGVPYKDGHAALFNRMVAGGTQATPPAFVAEFLRQLQQAKRRGFTSETAGLIDRLRAWVRSALDALRTTAGMTQRGELGPQIQSLMQRMQDVMDGREVAAPFRPGNRYRDQQSSFRSSRGNAGR